MGRKVGIDGLDGIARHLTHFLTNSDSAVAHNTVDSDFYFYYD
jgi:hypothetical protein